MITIQRAYDMKDGYIIGMNSHYNGKQCCAWTLDATHLNSKGIGEIIIALIQGMHPTNLGLKPYDFQQIN